MYIGSYHHSIKWANVLSSQISNSNGLLTERALKLLKKPVIDTFAMELMSALKRFDHDPGLQPFHANCTCYFLFSLTLLVLERSVGIDDLFDLFNTHLGLFFFFLFTTIFYFFSLFSFFSFLFFSLFIRILFIVIITI